MKNLPSFPSLHSTFLLFLVLLLCLHLFLSPFLILSFSLNSSCLGNDRGCFKFLLWPIHCIKESVFDDMKIEQANIFWLFADSFSSGQSIDLWVTYHFSHVFKGSDSQEREKITENKRSVCLCARVHFGAGGGCCYWWHFKFSLYSPHKQSTRKEWSTEKNKKKIVLACFEKSLSCQEVQMIKG